MDMARGQGGRLLEVVVVARRRSLLMARFVDVLDEDYIIDLVTRAGLVSIISPRPRRFSHIHSSCLANSLTWASMRSLSVLSLRALDVQQA